MGLAKKGSSLITIDGEAYRWVVSGNDGWLDLIVEQADGHGQRLCVQFDYEHGDMTPGTIRTIILDAMQNGWMPHSRGKELKFRLDEARLVPWEDWLAERQDMGPEDRLPDPP